jgi:hypothetical protein
MVVTVRYHLDFSYRGFTSDRQVGGHVKEVPALKDMLP